MSKSGSSSASRRTEPFELEVKSIHSPSDGWTPAARLWCLSTGKVTAWAPLKVWAEVLDIQGQLPNFEKPMLVPRSYKLYKRTGDLSQTGESSRQLSTMSDQTTGEVHNSPSSAVIPSDSLPAFKITTWIDNGGVAWKKTIPTEAPIADGPELAWTLMSSSHPKRSDGTTIIDKFHVPRDRKDEVDRLYLSAVKTGLLQEPSEDDPDVEVTAHWRERSTGKGNAADRGERGASVVLPKSTIESLVRFANGRFVGFHRGVLHGPPVSSDQVLDNRGV